MLLFGYLKMSFHLKPQVLQLTVLFTLWTLDYLMFYFNVTFVFSNCGRRSVVILLSYSSNLFLVYLKNRPCLLFILSCDIIAAELVLQTYAVFVPQWMAFILCIKYHSRVVVLFVFTGWKTPLRQKEVPISWEGHERHMKATWKRQQRQLLLSHSQWRLFSRRPISDCNVLRRRASGAERPNASHWRRRATLRGFLPQDSQLWRPQSVSCLSEDWMWRPRSMASAVTSSSTGRSATAWWSWTSRSAGLAASASSPTRNRRRPTQQWRLSHMFSMATTWNWRRP